jgi:hypothetical protein
VVPKASQNPAQDQEKGQGVWNTKDINLSYRYARSQGMLKISGDCTIHKRGLRYFQLQLFFLDAQGKVIESTGVLTATQGGPRSFQAEKPVPQGTRSFAFGYTGEAVKKETGGVPFSQYPFSSALEQ